MSRKVSIVVDTIFGDGGKGMLSNTLTNLHSSSIVVRYNGGHQAGHNVVLKDGRSHIHSSYPSGTISGVPGYITEHCIVYPTGMRNEYDVLREKGITPNLTVHPFAIVATPYDIVIGQDWERDNKHGSVGVGIGATMTRHKLVGHNQLTVADLFHPLILKHKMEQIRYHTEVVNLLDVPSGTMEWFMEDVDWMIANISVSGYNTLRDYENVIFEGAQGILLDMKHGMYPYVTFGNTTSQNAWDTITKAQLADFVSMFYVSRCYQTRHGRGPMSDERVLPLINNEGETNKTHDWQGKFRTGLFDPTLFTHAMQVDSYYIPSNIYTEPNIVITCTDQMETYPFVGAEKNEELGDMLSRLDSECTIFVSDNPYSEITAWN